VPGDVLLLVPAPHPPGPNGPPPSSRGDIYGGQEINYQNNPYYENKTEKMDYSWNELHFILCSY